MVTIKTPSEQDAMRASGRVLASVVNELITLVAPGVSLIDLENRAAEVIQKTGAKPAFKGYKGYNNILCTSVNEEVVHCPPTSRVLQSGDIVSIDAGVIVDGMYSDCAVTVPVGDVKPEILKLIQVTREALYDKARAVIKPGNTTGDIGAAVQQHAEAAGFSVVRSLVGHGIGRALHEDPSIPNYGEPGTGTRLEPGMCIAVEPMINFGTADVDFKDDGWRVLTVDGEPSAHFEHTFLITEQGCEVLTAL